jgi:two-component system chemotaxis response regulator CheB
VFGMPKEAIALGGVAEVLSIEHIAPRLLGLLTQQTAHIAR